MKRAKIFLQYFLLLLIILIGLVVIVSGRKEIGGYRLFVVSSGSMTPTIPVGALIITQAKSAYHVKDIVTFGSVNRKDATITHRIVGEKKLGDAAYFVTRGDANGSNDPQPLPPSGIIGKVTTIIPWVGYPIRYAATPAGAVVLIIIPGAIILWEEVKNVRKLIFPPKRVENESV